VEEEAVTGETVEAKDWAARTFSPPHVPKKEYADGTTEEFHTILAIADAVIDRMKAAGLSATIHLEVKP
jgi:hypothetical protein